MSLPASMLSFQPGWIRVRVRVLPELSDLITDFHSLGIEDAQALQIRTHPIVSPGAGHCCINAPDILLSVWVDADNLEAAYEGIVRGSVCELVKQGSQTRMSLRRYGFHSCPLC